MNRPLKLCIPFFLLYLAILFVGCPAEKSPHHPPSPPHLRTVQPPSRAPNPKKQAGLPLSSRFTKHQTFAFVMPQLGPLQGVGVPRAENCKACHTEIYSEWKQSTHAAALRDLQYQAELSKPGSPRWLCLNCHTPVQNQRSKIVRALRKDAKGRPSVFSPHTQPNPHYDPVMQREAITCATCHVRKDAAGKSYVIGAIGSPHAPHPIKKDPAFLRKICLRCHDPQGERLTKHLLCWFKTREELANGPFAKKQDCVSCHMPRKMRRLVPALQHLPLRPSHQHHWVGGGVPKSFAAYPTLLKRGYKPGVDIKLLSHSAIRPGQPITLALSITNSHAGHWMPTGDPERYLWSIAVLTDAQGQQIQRKTWRIGQLWKWEPMARKIGDNRLKPLETRTWRPTLQLPPRTNAQKLLIMTYHVRLSSQTARYMQTHASTYKNLPPSTRHQLAQIGKHYPLATILFRVDIDLPTGQTKRYTLQELMQLSHQERNIPLDKRNY